MRRSVRWLRNGVAGLFGLIVVAALAIFAVSEMTVRRAYKEPGRPVAVPSDAASIAEGARLARIRGCTGCHGDKLEGQMFIDEPMLARIASPNLTVAVREYSDAQLERIIRQGIRPDNRSVVGMPSDMFSLLDDADMGKILAYLRSVPEVSGQKRMMRPGPGGRTGIALRIFKPSAGEVRRAATLTDSFPAAGHPAARGAYLARTVCTECHGLDLNGGQGTPDLRIAAGYSREQFVRLMRTGKASGDRELELMSSVARNRFSHFTDDEIGALHDYLLARAVNQ